MTYLRQDGGVLVSCDFSKEMVMKLKKNYEQDTLSYSKIEGNKYWIDTKVDYRELDDNMKLKNSFDINKFI